MADFFEKVMDEMDKYMKAMGHKTGKFAGDARVWLEVNSLKKERDEVLKDLGSLVYKMNRRSAFDEKRIIERCRKIDDLNLRIKAAKEEKDLSYYEHRLHGERKRKHKDKRKENREGAGLVEADYYEIEEPDDI
ncbi:hypothetical protein [Oxobacter pfennigii]|nr:hypothetical protein [Oxobacter pfennigii]